MISPADKKICADKEVYAYGTAWLFQERARSLRLKLNILSWLSFGIPLLIGALLGVFDSPDILGRIKFASGILGGVLSFWGLWGLVAGWTDSLSKSERSVVANTSLREEWNEMQANISTDAPVRFAALKAKDLAQEQTDQLNGISNKDKSKMMRASLMQYQKQCAVCGTKPISMKPANNCATCSNF
jgi:mobilome CxxCx(11)CxxC protein